MTLRYLDPSCTDTLREGLRELRLAEAAQTDHGDMSGDVTADLEMAMEPHDAVHVLFACPTDLLGEVQAHLWMLLGTSARLSDMHRTGKTRDHRRVLTDIGVLRLLGTWLLAVPSALSIALRAGRLRRRWPVDRLEADLDRPLSAIRAELGL